MRIIDEGSPEWAARQEEMANTWLWIEGSKVYHHCIANCAPGWGIPSFHGKSGTEEEAQADGRRLCRYCARYQRRKNA
jgi:hypothetical protein